LKIHCNYDKDKLDGNYRQYYNDGKQKCCLTYCDGKLDGTCCAWYPGDTNQQSYQHNYCLGKKHGVCIDWYPSGQLRREYHYDNGNKHGQCKVWWYPESGKLQYCTHYVNNHIDKSNDG